jgi:hypothetical protein
LIVSGMATYNIMFHDVSCTSWSSGDANYH